MKNCLIFLLFISFETFSQKISFKINGVFNKEVINHIEVRKSPELSIDTIITKNEHQFEIIGKMDYPINIEVSINEYQAGYGVFSDGTPMTVVFDVEQDVTSKKKEFIIIQKEIEGNPISKSDNEITSFFRKIKFSENISEVQLSQIVRSIESHVNKYPTSYSNLRLIGANLDIMTDEKIGELFNRLPQKVQNEDSGPWILKTLSLRKRNVVGRVIPNFKLVDSLGLKHNVVDSSKSLTFIQFWASDCGPCRANNRKIVQLLPKIDLNKVSIVNVSLDTIEKNWLDALKKDKVSWLQLIENESFNSKIVKFFGFDSIPFDLLVDKDLKIVSIGFDKSMQKINSFLQK